MKNATILVLVILIAGGIVLGVLWSEKNIGPDMAEEIPWQQAQDLITQCQVQSAMQSHSLKVNLTLKSGQSLVTSEPGIDEMQKVISSVMEKCGPIMMGTE